MILCIIHAARFDPQDYTTLQRRLGDARERAGPSGLDKSLHELVKDNKKQSKTQHKKDTDVEKRSSEIQKKSSEDSGKGDATCVLAEGPSSPLKDNRDF